MYFMRKRIQKYKWQGEVGLVRHYNSRVGKASSPNVNIGHYGEETTDKTGAEMLEFHKPGMNSLATNRDVRKLKWQYKVRNIESEKWFPAIADRVVWVKVTEGRAQVRRDNVVETIWKGLGGDQEDIPVLHIDNFGGYKTEVK